MRFDFPYDDRFRKYGFEKVFFIRCRFLFLAEWARLSARKSKQIETPQCEARGGSMLARGKRAHSAENSFHLQI